MIHRRVRERYGWLWRVASPVVRGALFVTTRPRWIGGEHIPVEGGCLLVVNHISEVDPLVVAHLVWNHGRVPHYLAKSGLFRSRSLGYVMRGLGQIPVERATRSAADAYAAAVQAIHDGSLVVVYPEGTITRDPDLWPMTGKTGAARLALETGCRVVPVGQWGAQDLLAPYSHRPDLFPRKSITMLVGETLDLSDLAARPRTAATVAEATVRIMAAITGLVEEVRGASAPTDRYDMRRHPQDRSA